MKKFNPSLTNIITARANEMQSQGIHIFNFASGDPVLKNHPSITEGILTEKSPYAPVAGFFDLRKAAADWMNRRYKTQFGIENTVVTCGGKFGLYAAFQILLEAGDEVLFPAPYWVSYPEMIRLARGNPKAIPTTEQNNWKITPDDLKRHLTAKTKILLLNNPCNPTGALYSRSELAALLQAAAEANLFIIADEVYSELVYDGAEFVSCSSFPEYASHTLIIESCSKNFGMAGWRVGFAFGPKELITSMIALQSQSTTGTSHISQRAALAALQHSEEVAANVRNAMQKRRDLFFKTYNRLFGTHHKPVEATIYFFAPIHRDSLKACEEILAKTRVALVPGIAFGMEGYVRFAFSETEEEIIKGLEILKQFTR